MQTGDYCARLAARTDCANNTFHHSISWPAGASRSHLLARPRPYRRRPLAVAAYRVESIFAGAGARRSPTCAPAIESINQREECVILLVLTRRTKRVRNNSPQAQQIAARRTSCALISLHRANLRCAGQHPFGLSIGASRCVAANGCCCCCGGGGGGCFCSVRPSCARRSPAQTAHSSISLAGRLVAAAARPD